MSALVLYGSQTGTAEGVAERLARQATRRGYATRLSAMDAYAIGELAAERLVVFVVSTTGDGDVPDNMKVRAGGGEGKGEAWGGSRGGGGVQRTWSFLLQRGLPEDGLEGVGVAVFGLGDSTYPKFCAAARRLRARLLQLGAHEVCERGLADERSALGTEGDADAWTSKVLWPAVHARFPPPADASAWERVRLMSARWRVRATGEEEGAEAYRARAWDAAALPAGAMELEVVCNERMTAADWEQDVRRVQLRRVGGGTPAEGPGGSVAAEAPGSGSAPVDGSGGVSVAAEVVSPDVASPHVASPVVGPGRGWYAAGDVLEVWPESETRDGEGVVERLARRVGVRADAVLVLEVASEEEGRVEERERVEERAEEEERAEVEERERVEERAEEKERAEEEERAWEQVQEKGWRLALRGGEVDFFLPGRGAPYVPVGRATTLREVLSRYLDPCAPVRRGALEQLSLFAASEEERDKLQEMASARGADLYLDYVVRERRGMADVLDDFSSVRLSVPHLLSLLPALRARDFSIASSPRTHADVAELCVAVVRRRTFLRRRVRGLASTWIASLPRGTRVAARVKPGTLRAPPPDVPALLIGPGTGVAPLRAFLLDRSPPPSGDHAGRAPPGTPALPPWSLYFGCRHREKDFLFRHDWDALLAAGQLAHLHAAFSRDQDAKVYVQTLLVRNRAAVARALLHQGAHVLICGAASRMPRDVKDALLTILQTEGSLSAEDAAAFLLALERAGRLQTETWS